MSPMVAVKNKELLSVFTFLKVFRKRIAVQARHLDQKSQLARRKAIKLRKEGDVNSAREQMKTHLQIQAWNSHLDRFQLKLEGLLNELEQAKTMDDVSTVLTDIANAIKNLSTIVLTPEFNDKVELFRQKIADWGLLP